MALPKRQKEPSNPKGRCNSVSMGFPLVPYQASLLGSFDLNEYRLQLGFTWVREGKITNRQATRQRPTIVAL